MIIAFRSQYSLRQILTVAQWLIGLLTGVLFLGFAIALIRSNEGISLRKLPSSTKEEHFNLEKMLTGPLSLKENIRSPLALALEQKLALLAQSMRPDVKKENRAFSIGVNGSDARRVVKEGEKIYFQIKQHPSGGIEEFTFVNEPTNSWMIPHVLDGQSLLLKIEGDDSMEVILEAHNGWVDRGEGSIGMTALREARWWGTDCFFRQYGGPEFQVYSQKQKIEIFDGETRYVLFVFPNEFLSFYNGRWYILENLSTANPNAPLAQVRMNGNQLEVEAWDSEGFSLCHSKLDLKRGVPPRISPNTLLKDAKLRSKNQVTCHMEKKRFILRPSDWLLKTDKGWHKLKGLEEINAYITQDIRGELFVIDAIDPSGIRGRYFDEMRTHMQDILLPISVEKNTKNIKKIKKRSKKRAILSD